MRKRPEKENKERVEKDLLPMLHNARPIHSIDIRQSNWLRQRILINPQMDKPGVVVEVMSQNGAGYERDDVGQLCCIGITALRIEWIMLDQVKSDEISEC